MGRPAVVLDPTLAETAKTLNPKTLKMVGAGGYKTLATHSGLGFTAGCRV